MLLLGAWLEASHRWKADREALADYLATLPEDAWSTPSLCDRWDLKGVAVHLLVTPTMSKGKVFLAFAGAGFNLDKFSQKQVDRMSASMSPAEIVETTRSTAGSQSAPPGLKPMGVLTEVLVHGGDITTPLGASLDVPADHYVAAMDHLKSVNPVFGTKKRIEGLQLRATDADWSTGDGPVVQGPSAALLLAMAGREAGYESLAGDGVATMRSR